MQENYYDDKTLKKLQKIELGILKEFDEICVKNKLKYFLIGGTAIGAVRHKGFIPWDDDIDVGMKRDDYDKFLKLAEEKYSDRYTIVNNDHNHAFPVMNTRWSLKGTEFKTEDLKDIPGEFGIFLDIFCFDNVSDNDKLMKRQHTMAWVYGKMSILSAVKKPTLYYYGLKRKILASIFFIAHYVLKIFGLHPRFFYQKAMKHAKKYQNIKTKRIAYMFEPKRYMSMLYLEDIYPVKRMKFENFEAMVPNNIEKLLELRYGDYMTLPPVEKRHNHPPYSLKFDMKENKKESK